MFEEVKAKGDKTTRKTRSEAAKAEEQKQNADIDAAMEEESKVEEVIDPLEFAPEKDVLSNFGPEWQDATAAIKKWDDKVAKLTELIKACNNVKIKNGHTDALVGFLKKEVVSSNINISVSAIEASTAVAAGMKENFLTGAKALCPVIFGKFKEKRTLVQ